MLCKRAYCSIIIYLVVLFSTILFQIIIHEPSHQKRFTVARLAIGQWPHKYYFAIAKWMVQMVVEDQTGQVQRVGKTKYNTWKHLLKVSGWHSRYGFFIAILIPHQSFGCQMTFGCHSHLLTCACYVLVFQIHLEPIVFVPTCNRIKIAGKKIENVIELNYSESW